MKRILNFELLSLDPTLIVLRKFSFSPKIKKKKLKKSWRFKNRYFFLRLKIKKLRN